MGTETAGCGRSVAAHRHDDGLDAHARAAVAELRTVTDLVRWGAARLDEARVTFGHGTDNAVDEALALVLHAAGLRPGAPEPLLASRLVAVERRAAVGLIVRRIRERIPAPYLTGRAWFAGLELACDARALVPRSPIAEWIERGFEPWLDPDAVERVLDIGTGGGAIAIACALAFPDAAVDAVDISDEALALARENCVAHGVGDRVSLFESDVYAGVGGRYDLIVGNPPYVDAETMAALDPEYLHEPRTGLEAGADGLGLRAPGPGRSERAPPFRRRAGVRSGRVPSRARTRIPHGPVHLARARAGRGRDLPADGRAARGAGIVVSGAPDAPPATGDADGRIDPGAH